MSVRLRYVVVALLAVAVVAFVAGRRLLFPGGSLHASNLSSPASQSYLIALGVGNTAPTAWDGSIAATSTGTGAAIPILSLQGWRFTGTDSISGTTSWKMSSRQAPPPPSATAGPMQENGIIVTIAATSASVTFAVTTAQGNFSFASTHVPFGTQKVFMKDPQGSYSVHVYQTGAGLQLTTSNEEEDFPSMAQSGDDVYLALGQPILAGPSGHPDFPAGRTRWKVRPPSAGKPALRAGGLAGGPLHMCN
jgi:hypothetical protein